MKKFNNNIPYKNRIINLTNSKDIGSILNITNSNQNKKANETGLTLSAIEGLKMAIKTNRAKFISEIKKLSVD